MARLFADANFPRGTVDRLRRLGHDVRTVQQEQGTSRPQHSLSDADVLSLATRQRRAVLTLNIKHFEQEGEKQPGHAGIIACRRDNDPHRQAKMIDARIKAAKGLTAQILYIAPPVKGKRRRRE